MTQTCVLCGREGTRQYLDWGVFGVPVCSNFDACDKRYNKRRRQLLKETNNHLLASRALVTESRIRYNANLAPQYHLPVPA